MYGPELTRLGLRFPPGEIISTVERRIGLARALVGVAEEPGVLAEFLRWARIWGWTPTSGTRRGGGAGTGGDSMCGGGHARPFAGGGAGGAGAGGDR